MDFNGYFSFLATQADLVDRNNQANGAASATKDLINKGQAASTRLKLFPSLDKELAEATNSCLNNHDNIAKVWSSFYQSDLDSLGEKLENLSNVEANISNALNLPKFIEDVYRYTTTQDLAANITLAEGKLSDVNDKRGALQLGDTKLQQKLKELDNALTSNGFLVSVSDRHKEEGAKIKKQSKDLLSLTSSNVQSLIYDIDSLTSRIKSDLDERGGERMKQAGIVAGILVLFLIIFANWEAFLKLVENVIFVIGVIIVLWVLYKISSFFNNN